MYFFYAGGILAPVDPSVRKTSTQKDEAMLAIEITHTLDFLQFVYNSGFGYPFQGNGGGGIFVVTQNQSLALVDTSRNLVLYGCCAASERAFQAKPAILLTADTG